MGGGDESSVLWGATVLPGVSLDGFVSGFENPEPEPEPDPGLGLGFGLWFPVVV